MFVCLRHSFLLLSFPHFTRCLRHTTQMHSVYTFIFCFFRCFFLFFAVFLNCSSSHMLIHVVNDCSTISFLEKFTCVLLIVQTSTITQAHTHTKRQSKNTKAFKNNSIPYAPVCANFVCLFASFFPLILVQFSVYTLWNGFMVMVWCANLRHFVSFQLHWKNIWLFFSKKRKKK